MTRRKSSSASYYRISWSGHDSFNNPNSPKEDRVQWVVEAYALAALLQAAASNSRRNHSGQVSQKAEAREERWHEP